ncbi:MAG: hypothetical protein PVJ86_08805 [Phycisphaerales bacterium]|jgi:hypothetical protein
MVIQAETVRRVAGVQEQLDNFVRPELPDDLISPFLALPGLRGFWPMSAFQSNGDCFDQSGNGRLLTYNGNPTYNYDDLVPYIDLDGTGDYLLRGDEAGLDITGLETYVAAAVRGLTAGGWFWIDSHAAESTLISKYDVGGNQRTFSLHIAPAGNLRGYLSNNGVAFETIAAGVITTGEWFFAVFRFDPGNEKSLFLNNVETVQATAYASLHLGTADLLIGGIHGGTRLLDGRASLCFLCATLLSDGILSSLFQQTRPVFGV